MRNYLPFAIMYKYRNAKNFPHIAASLFQSSARSYRPESMAIVLPSHFGILDCLQDDRRDSTLFLTELGRPTIRKVQKERLTEDLRQCPFQIRVRDVQSSSFD